VNVVERLNEEDPNQEWLLNFHREIYGHIIPFIKNKNILDIACGFGYATNLYIQNGASSVTGVDISEETINEAKKLYKILFFLKKTFIYKIFLKFIANPKIENNLSNCTIMVITAKKFFNT